MGKANRERRAAKKRKQERRCGESRMGEGRAWAGSTGGPELRFSLVVAATVIGRRAEESDVAA